MRARRAQSALLTNAISSIGNLAVAITIARAGSLSELGAFGIAFSLYSLATGLTGAAVTQSVLSQPGWKENYLSASHRVTLVATIFGATTTALGILLSYPYLTIIGLTIPGLAIYDYLKVVTMAVGHHGRALIQECAWTGVVVLTLCASLLVSISPIWIFAVWAVSGMTIGLTHAALVGCALRPQWNADPSESRVATSFGLDFLAGSGVAQMSYSALAVTAGDLVVGSLRGASTLLGPITLVANTARALLIPHLLAGSGMTRKQQARRAWRTTGILVTLVLPLALAATFIPEQVGHALLGTNWDHAKPLMPALACELIFVVAATVPFAGHRVARVGRRTLTIRLCMAPVRIGGVIIASLLFGAQGAAIALASLAVISCAIWWLSYRRILLEGEANKV